MASDIKKRPYDATGRQAQSKLAKERILLAASELFKANGFDAVTIEAIANKAGVSVPTVYSKFKSKRGILSCIIDNALPTSQHDALVSKIYTSNSATEQLQLTAKLSRKLYEAEY
ncbi:MAG: TetR/AcrR family transcriptional regulator [Pseudomonadota bacterium]